ncbi:MAG: FprA family A-type flavoprotein, partial [Dehalococcoidia bacterium]|nr:FprA family A-type flavoprotein [Dehalococcoidia bacterium]
AYLIVDEKTALIDGVKAPFKDELFRNITEICDPSAIDYVISLHVERDHSSALPFVMERAPGATLVTTERFGEQGLEANFHRGWRFHSVKDGDRLSLGWRHISFIATPLAHWPDSMMAYLEEDSVLFSSDLYGQHLATSPRFADQVASEILRPEAAKYYANIFMPYSSQAGRALEKTRALAPKLIVPSHGLMWRKDMDWVLESYGRWTQGLTVPRVVVVYDTMYGSTEMMAQAMRQGAEGEGVEVQLYRLTGSSASDIMAHILEAGAVCIGSPVLHGGIYPTVAAFLSYLRGFRPKGKLGVAFSSYGWVGIAAKAISQEMEDAGMEVVQPSLEANFVPDEEALDRCRQAAAVVARRVKAAAA